MVTIFLPNNPFAAKISSLYVDPFQIWFSIVIAFGQATTMTSRSSTLKQCVDHAFLLSIASIVSHDRFLGSFEKIVQFQV